MDQPFPGADTYGGECAFDIATKSDDHVLKLVAIAAVDEKSAHVLDDDGHVLNSRATDAATKVRHAKNESPSGCVAGVSVRQAREPFAACRSKPTDRRSG